MGVGSPPLTAAGDVADSEKFSDRVETVGGFRIHWTECTASTNLDARAGRPGDVFVADEQTAGRGRLDHRWTSAAGENLLMSAVFDGADLPPEHVATFPLVVGLAVANTVRDLGGGTLSVGIKWPNDVLIGGRKVAGILCERIDDRIIAGIGVNVCQRVFPAEIAVRATSLAVALDDIGQTGAKSKRPLGDLGQAGSNPTQPPDGLGRKCPSRKRVLRRLLSGLGDLHATWRRAGLAPFLSALGAYDILKGKKVSVFQTDGDPVPVTGRCGGIRADGTLDVNGVSISAGEAHVREFA